MRISGCFSCFALATLLAGVAAPGHAQVAARSPFMPARTAVTNAPTEGAPLEYRGFIETGEGVQFRIFDPSKKTGAWVRLDQRNEELDVVAKQHSPEHQTLTIEHGGKTLTLAERKAKIVSSGNAAAMPPPPVVAQPVVAPAVTQTVVLNPTPADEQRRLEAVAAEVARRRALREQATQQISQGNAPQVAIPQVQPNSIPRNLQQVPQGNAGNSIRQRPQAPANRQQR